MGSFPPQGGGGGGKTKQTFYSYVASTIGAGVTTFMSIGLDEDYYSVEEADLSIQMGRSGTVTRLAVFINFGNTLSGVFDITLRKAQGNTGLAVQFSAGQEALLEDTTPITFIATDELNLSMVTAAGTGVSGNVVYALDIEWD